MRAKSTRNAEKSTPSSKKVRRGTPRGTPKSVKQDSVLEPEVTNELESNIQEETAEPMDKDERDVKDVSQVNVDCEEKDVPQVKGDCNEGDNGKEKDVNCPDISEEITSGDMLISNETEEPKKKDGSKDEDVSQPDMAKEVIATQVDTESEPVELKKEHAGKSEIKAVEVNICQHSREDNEVESGKQVDEAMKEGSLNNNGNEQCKDEEGRIEQECKEESGKQIDETMKEGYVNGDDKEKPGKDEEAENTN